MGEWEQQREEWRLRIERYGPERSARNVGNATPEQVAAFDQAQRAAVIPHLQSRVTSRDRPALDFGCGVGRWSGVLAGLCGRCIAIDPTPEILATACAGRREAAVDFQPYLDGRIPVEAASVGVVFACLVLNTIKSEEMLAATAAEFARVLRPSGLLFVVDLTGRARREGRWSVARSAEEYAEALLGVAPLEVLGEYQDGADMHSIMAGRRPC